MVKVIYALRDPLTDEVRYVGQTRDPFRRLMDHLADALRGHRSHNPEKDEWLATLLLRHREAPIVEVLEFVEGKPFLRERWWIEKFRADGEPLLNRDNNAWTRTPEGRARISAINKGRKQSPEVVARRAAGIRETYRRRREASA